MSEFPDFKQRQADIYKKFKVEVPTPPKPNKRPTQPILERSRGGPEPLYNIHKRSLPVGLDRIVGWGFTMKQAKKHIARHHKVKSLPLERHQEVRTVVYYDVIHQDDEGGDIYKNSVELIQENT